MLTTHTKKGLDMREIPPRTRTRLEDFERRHKARREYQEYRYQRAVDEARNAKAIMFVIWTAVWFLAGYIFGASWGW